MIEAAIAFTFGPRHQAGLTAQKKAQGRVAGCRGHALRDQIVGVVGIQDQTRRTRMRDAARLPGIVGHSQLVGVNRIERLCLHQLLQELMHGAALIAQQGVGLPTDQAARQAAGFAGQAARHRHSVDRVANRA